MKLWTHSGKFWILQLIICKKKNIEFIFLYLCFCRKDYGSVPKTVLLDMVKVLTFALSEGKVAIHSHAGLGRTGVLVACYLIYTLRCKPTDAVAYVRNKRYCLNFFLFLLSHEHWYNRNFCLNIVVNHYYSYKAQISV